MKKKKSSKNEKENEKITSLEKDNDLANGYSCACQLQINDNHPQHGNEGKTSDTTLTPDELEIWNNMENRYFKVLALGHDSDEDLDTKEDIATYQLASFQSPQKEEKGERDNNTYSETIIDSVRFKLSPDMKVENAEDINLTTDDLEIWNDIEHRYFKVLALGHESDQDLDIKENIATYQLALQSHQKVENGTQDNNTYSETLIDSVHLRLSQDLKVEKADDVNLTADELDIWKDIEHRYFKVLALGHDSDDYFDVNSNDIRRYQVDKCGKKKKFMSGRLKLLTSCFRFKHKSTERFGQQQ